jgi:hypothetical protein
MTLTPVSALPPAGWTSPRLSCDATGSPMKQAPGSSSHYAGSTKALAFSSSALLKPIQMVMDPINNNKLVELVLTDFVGFVAPRTYIDASQRGVDAGREVFLREMMGTITNTYLCGWLMLPMLSLLDNRKVNNKAVSMRAWIDTSTLDRFSKTTNRVLNQAKDVKDIQRLFLDNILSSMHSTDAIHQLPQFKRFFPSKGQLNPKIKEQIIDELMGRRGLLSTLQAHPNIDREVGNFLRSAASNRAVLEQSRRQVIEDFLAERGLNQPYELTPRGYRRMREVISETQSKLAKTQWQSARDILTKAIRSSEKPFLTYLTDLAIQEGGLSENVVLHKASGFPDMKIGVRSVSDVFTKLKYFVEEYLNPAMTSNGQMFEGPLTPALRARIRKGLFHSEGKTWWQRLVVPSAKDGLVPYTIKLKRPMLLVPLGITIAIASTFVLVNNWITRRKYKGQDFFPGEGLPDELKLTSKEAS